MPPSTPDTLARTATPHTGAETPDGALPGDGRAVVEAPTAEQALQEVQRRHGAAARIVQAEKVLRGGVGGFFQRELVQLTVDLGAGTASAEQRPLTPRDVHHDGVGRRFLDAVQEAIARDEGDGTAPAGETFAELLDRAVGPQAPDGSLLDATAAAPGELAEPPAGGVEAALAQLTAEAEAGERAGARPWGDALPRAEQPPPAADEVAAAAPHGTDGRAPARSVDDVAAEARLRAARRMREAAAAAAPPAPAGSAPAGPATGPSTTPDPAPGAADRAATAPGAPGAAGVADERPAWAVRVTTPDGPWSLEGLVRLGVPRALVAAVDAHRPTDDLAWLTAVVAAVRDRCGELPPGRALLVGPRAVELADARGVDVHVVGEQPSRRGHLSLEGTRDELAGLCLQEARRSRWLEVVAGGEGWRDWLWDEPGAVSWATPAALPEALATAVELGLPLGHGLRDGRALRATPVEVALVLRTLLEVRA